MAAETETETEGEEAVIRVRGLVTRFGTQTIHDGLDLDVRPGEVIGVVGGSGTGKSVLLRTIIGLNRPVEGEIRLLGYNIMTLKTEKQPRMRRRIGVSFQDGALFSSMTVAENIEVPLKRHTDLGPALRRELVRIKIDMVGLQADAAWKYPSELSGGMRKRAGLARALVLDPEILFLDEPTAGLDPIGAAAIDRLILRLKQDLGLTVFLVTHDLDSLVTICDRIAVLIDKRVVVDTLPRLMDHPNPWMQDYFRGPRARSAGLGDGQAPAAAP